MKKRLECHAKTVYASPMKPIRTFLLNKLVRDNIVDSMQTQGLIPDYTVVSKEDFLEGLRAKIIEEISEASLKNPQETLKELADVQEVVDAILREIGKTKEELSAAQAIKNQKSGAFTRRLYVKEVAVPSGSEWADYYAKEPERFPER